MQHQQQRVALFKSFEGSDEISPWLSGLDNNIKEESGSKHTTDRSKNRNKLDQEIESESLLVAPRESKCSTCHKVFPTLQALGGHRSSHSYKNNLQAMDSALELIELDWNVMAFVHMHCLLKQSIRIRTTTGGWFCGLVSVYLTKATFVLLGYVGYNRR